ncbi:uncharacterized protein [Montipora capricornis]|uniref:uncharacterized protein n=1 Tax=Montipora capricornis TaxID=246305 RepID=UPI0035F215F9
MTKLVFMGYGCLGEADKNDTIPFDLSHDSESFLLCPDMMEVNTGCTSDQLLQVHNSVRTETTTRPETFPTSGMQFRQGYLREFIERQGISANSEDSGESESGSQLEPVIVRVHRTHLRDDLIKLFSDPEILHQTIEWRMIDDHGREEEGVRAGVQRDIFSTFWQSVFCSYTLGDLEKVPCIRHDLQKSAWEAGGRVLTYGFKNCGYIPVCLSPVFLASCLHGEDQVDEEELLASFSNYVTCDERDALKMSLSDNLIA